MLKLYDLYESHGALNIVTEEAEQRGIRSRRRLTKSGDWRGGKVLSRGHIYYILTSPIYAGRIPHKGKAYEGQHTAIIEPKRWQRVQEQLRNRSPAPGQQAVGQTSRSPLLGKLFDENGERLSPSHTKKCGRRYRYYISRGYVMGRKESLKGRGWRLPAEQLEQAVAEAIRTYISSAAIDGIVADAQVETLKKLRDMNAATQDQLLALLSRVTLKVGMMSLVLDAERLARTLNSDPDVLNTDQLSFGVPFTQRRRGVETRLFLSAPTVQVDRVLVANIARSHDWLDRVRRGEPLDMIARAAGTTKKRVQQTLEYAFLAPDIVRDVLTGHQPPGLTSTWVATHALPSDWNEQRALISSL